MSVNIKEVFRDGMATSSELLDVLFDTLEGEKKFIELCEDEMDVKITFNDKLGMYIVEERKG